MSQENVEIVRKAFMEWERGNLRYTEVFDPNVEMVGLLAVAAGETDSVTVGLENMRTAMKGWLQSWDHSSVAAEQILDAGDQVVIVATWRGRGKASGVVTEWRHGQVWTMRDGKVTRTVAYTDPAEALEAVGLSE